MANVFDLIGSGGSTVSVSVSDAGGVIFGVDCCRWECDRDLTMTRYLYPPLAMVSRWEPAVPTIRLSTQNMQMRDRVLGIGLAFVSDGEPRLCWLC
jgi:hypothetical protein